VRSRTEIVPSVLLFMEIVPKNVARVEPLELIDLNSPRADRSKQPMMKRMKKNNYFKFI